MATPKDHAQAILARILEGGGVEDMAARLRPRPPEHEPLPPRMPSGRDYTAESLARRRQILKEQGRSTACLSGACQDPAPEDLEGNMENFVGFARIPVGVLGPLRVNGLHASGDFYVPLATTEGALLASYHRGARLLSRAGGVTALCLTESVSRAPCFVFANVREAGLFLSWALPKVEELQAVVATTSSHCRLLDVRTTMSGREVFMGFEYSTGDAAGQNMVTLATEAVCGFLLDGAPVKPMTWYLEGNMSGDKKATMLSFTSTRGRQVVAEALIPGELVERYLHVTPLALMRYWQVSIVGGIQSGSIGVQGHYANALAALFIACGQDAACVSEASIGLTRFDVTDAGELYAAVSLPNLIVGTVGGGTWLPTARECLEMMDCYGTGKARKFAEICAATAMAGELSLTAAMASGDFGRAHAELGRKRKPS